MKNAANDEDGPMPLEPRSPLIVSSDVGASPEKRLEMLTPSSASSPVPSEIRDSMSAASGGWLETTSRPRSFSYQRKAGMSSLRPCRMPAWLTGVVDGSEARHSCQVCEPSRTQRASVGKLPLLTPHSSTGAGSPSSCTMTTPGSSVSSPRSPRLVASRMTCT